MKIIKKIRKRKGLTQKQLGERLGCKQPLISRWESGLRKPSAILLLKIILKLNLTREDLVYWLQEEEKKYKRKEKNNHGEHDS